MPTVRHPNYRRTQDAWDTVARDDFASALGDLADTVVVDNGPGAGPWRHVEGEGEPTGSRISLCM